MAARSWGWFAGLVALTVGFGLAAVYGAPATGAAIGIWPAALATALLMIAPKPSTPVVLLLIFAIAFGTIATGRPESVAFGIAVGMTVQCWAFWRVLTGGVRDRPPLRTNAELGRYIGGSALGALCVGVSGVVTSLVTGWGDPLLLGLSVLASSLASNLAVTPFFCRLRPHPGLAPPVERAAQWVLIVTLTPVVFYLDDFPSLVFALIPVLAWGALRSGAYESIAQLFVVLGFAIALTTRDHGPFAEVDSRFGLPADVQGLLLSLFIIDCALVVVPFVLIVGDQLENARQVAAERDMVQNIVNGAGGVAIIGTDAHGLVTLVNPGAEQLLGYSAEEMLGRTTEYLHSDEAIAEKARELGVQPEFREVARTLLGAGPTDMPFVRKDGVVRSHSMSLDPIEDDRGQVTGYVSTSEDITERKEAERRLVEALATEREAVARLQEVDRVKDAFVSSVSHELRTPITSILGYTEMLEDGVYGQLSHEQLDAVQRLSANSSRLLSLIDDLLTLSRIQEDGIGFAHKVVDLRKVVAAGVAVVAPTLERRELELDVDLPEDPAPCLGDRDMLERVVINLLGNAVKFTPEGGRLQVALTIHDGQAEVAVADTGIGIPAEEQDQLFSRFFRSSLAQQQAIPGSGLGLSIAHAIVEKHGGTMTVESEEGEGTVFRVRLPLITAD
ncbi:ATP-binding protein [Nocardioides sp.]|uniref:ATP-binding protein n=1 Tax=Nocardioides sp. TaxID=35761 RepID=UPI003783BB2D